MFRYLLITISWFIALQAIGQDTIKLQNTSDISCMSIDAKGNIFIADNKFTLSKFTNKGEQVTNVNIKSYGEITSIDCSNPFEIYVFHKDQNIIVFYDNMLNLRGELRLSDYFYNNVSCIARSFDNNIWIVDLSQYKLLKINKKGEILSESPYLNSILGEELNIYNIWEYKNEVFIADSAVGIYVFDMYATYKNTYSTFSHKASIGTEQKLYLSLKNKLAYYNTLIKDYVTMEVTLPEKTSFSLFNNHLYFYDKDMIVSVPLS